MQMEGEERPVVVLVANESLAALAPLDQGFSSSTLPVGGKSLLHHAIEEFVDAGFDHIHIVMHPDDKSASWLGDGSRWNVNFVVDVVSVEFDLETFAQSYAKKYSGRDLIVASTGKIRVGCVTAVMDSYAQLDRGMYRLSNFAGFDLGIVVKKTGQGAEAGGETLQLPSPMAMVVEIIDLYTYYLANISLVSNQLINATPNGSEIKDGVFVHYTAKCPTEWITGTNVLVGPRCTIREGVQIQSDSVINSDVFIDRGTIVSNSVILPGTYVGRDLTIDNAIVWAEDVIRVDLGIGFRVPDEFLLSKTVTRTQYV